MALWSRVVGYAPTSGCPREPKAKEVVSVAWREGSLPNTLILPDPQDEAISDLWDEAVLCVESYASSSVCPREELYIPALSPITGRRAVDEPCLDLPTLQAEGTLQRLHGMGIVEPSPEDEGKAKRKSDEATAPPRRTYRPRGPPTIEVGREQAKSP